MDKIEAINITKSTKKRGLVEKTETQKLRWFEHVSSMEESRTADTVWEIGTDKRKKEKT